GRPRGGTSDPDRRSFGRRRSGRAEAGGRGRAVVRSCGTAVRGRWTADGVSGRAVRPLSGAGRCGPGAVRTSAERGGGGAACRVGDGDAAGSGAAEPCRSCGWRSEEAGTVAQPVVVSRARSSGRNVGGRWGTCPLCGTDGLRRADI